MCFYGYKNFLNINSFVSLYVVRYIPENHHCSRKLQLHNIYCTHVVKLMKWQFITSIIMIGNESMWLCTSDQAKYMRTAMIWSLFWNIFRKSFSSSCSFVDLKIFHYHLALQVALLHPGLFSVINSRCYKDGVSNESCVVAWNTTITMRWYWHSCYSALPQNNLSWSC